MMKIPCSEDTGFQYQHKPIRDLLSPIKWQVNPLDFTRAVRYDGTNVLEVATNCAGAIGGERECGRPVHVWNKVSYIDMGDYWVQGFNSDSLKRVVLLNDNHATPPEPITVVLNPRPKGQERGRDRKAKGATSSPFERVDDLRSGRISNAKNAAIRWGISEDEAEEFIEPFRDYLVTKKKKSQDPKINTRIPVRPSPKDYITK